MALNAFWHRAKSANIWLFSIFFKSESKPAIDFPRLSHESSSIDQLADSVATVGAESWLMKNRYNLIIRLIFSAFWKYFKLFLFFIFCRKWNEELLDDAINWLSEDLPLELNAPGGMVAYRETLTASFFLKFYVHVKNHLSRNEIIQVGYTFD